MFHATGAAVAGQHDTNRLRAAAHHATKAYPGAVGQLLRREILSWDEIGFRFGGESLIHRAVEEILATPAHHAPAQHDALRNAS